VSQDLIRTGKPSELLTRIATTEKRFVARVDEKLTCICGIGSGGSRFRRIGLTGNRDSCHTRCCLETGVRAGSFSPGAFFPFSDLHCEGSTRRGQTDKGK
jgi:hypothetical protein